MMWSSVLMTFKNVMQFLTKKGLSTKEFHKGAKQMQFEVLSLTLAEVTTLNVIHFACDACTSV